MSTLVLITESYSDLWFRDNYPLVAQPRAVTCKAHLGQGVAWLMSKHLKRLWL